MFESLDAVIGFSVAMLGVALLVTVLVQMASTVLSLRSTSLLNALSTLFKQSGLEAGTARYLAEQILRHPLINDSAFTFGMLNMASAIRKEELVRLLNKHEEYGIKLADPSRLLDNVGVWFDSQMDRASEMFAQRARLVTILMSLLVAFGLHLDAPDLLRRLYRDSDLRSRLVASAAVLESRAEGLGVTGAAPPSAASAAAVPAAPAKTTPLPNAAGSARVKATGDDEFFTSGAAASATMDGGSTAAGSGGSASAAPPALAIVPPAPPQASVDDLQKSVENLRDLKSDLDNAGLELLPRYGARLNLDHGVHTPFDYFSFTPEGSRHLLGIFAGAVLLSLGAPFWFNLLKQLMNLRSVVANKEQDERENAV